MINILDQIVLNNRISWDEYFMGISIITSYRSPCNRLHVGCTIVKDNRIISVGYNGFLPNAEHNSRIRDNHEQSIIHAEQNAVSDAAGRGVCINNSIAYITHYPCINCFKILISSGIEEIVYLHDYKNDEFVNQLNNDLINKITIRKLMY